MSNGELHSARLNPVCGHRSEDSVGGRDATEIMLVEGDIPRGLGRCAILVSLLILSPLSIHWLQIRSIKSIHVLLRMSHSSN